VGLPARSFDLARPGVAPPLLDAFNTLAAPNGNDLELFGPSGRGIASSWFTESFLPNIGPERA